MSLSIGKGAKNKMKKGDKVVLKKEYYESIHAMFDREGINTRCADELVKGAVYEVLERLNSDLEIRLKTPRKTTLRAKGRYFKVLSNDLTGVEL